jgi:polyhydroxybutyrate depolymerase
MNHYTTTDADHEGCQSSVSPRLAAFLAAAVLIAGCGSGGNDTANETTSEVAEVAEVTEVTEATQTASTEPAVPGLLTGQTLQVNDTERKFHAFVPSEPDGAPLVMLFHGNGVSNNILIGQGGVASAYRVWLDIAATENVIVVVPRGITSGWNDCRADASSNSEADDVAFVSALIDDIVLRYGADPARVYAQGTSNGGHMSIRLAEELPDRIAAFAAVAAADSANSECETSDVAVSAMFINGTADQVMPYEGGRMINRALVFFADETIAAWVARNGIDTAPEIIEQPDINPADDSTVTVSTFTGGIDGSEVVLVSVTGGGHNAPSIAERITGSSLELFGPQNGDIETAELTWAFFEDKTR